MGPPTEQLIRDYLNRLSVAARDLAADDRRALLERTRQVIERRANLASRPTTMDVGRVLARLGDPASLVEQERRRLATAPAKTAGSGEPVPAARPGLLARALGRQPGRIRGASWRWPTQREGGDAVAPGSANGVADGSHPDRPGDGETSEPPAGQARPAGTVTADVAGDAPPAPPAAASDNASAAAGAPGSAGPYPMANGTGDHAQARPRTESAPQPAGPAPAQPAPSAAPPSAPAAVPQSAPAAPSQASEPQPPPQPPPVAGPDQQEPGEAAAAAPPAGATPSDLGADGGGAARDVSAQPGDAAASAAAGGAAGDGRQPPPGPDAGGSAEPSSGAPGPRWLRSTQVAGSTGWWVLLGRLVSWARRRPLEAAAIVLMGIGGPIFPPVFLIGATVALGSELWDGRDKWLGLALPVVLTVIGLAVGVAAGGRAHWQHESWLYLDVISRIAPVLGAAYLGWRCGHLRRPPAEPPYSRPRRTTA